MAVLTRMTRAYIGARFIIRGNSFAASEMDSITDITAIVALSTDGKDVLNDEFRVMMAAEEHKNLSTFVKTVHQMLRHETQKNGADKAWQEHCSKSEILQEYATSMQKLASTFWEQNSVDKNKSAWCRIKWVVEKCVLYFFEGEIEIRRIREKEKCNKITNDIDSCAETSVKHAEVKASKEIQSEAGCLTLLDVGSCYNPFRVYPLFHVIPIDIAPAEPDVYVCDFLNLAVVEREESMILSGRFITELPAGAFDVVVFSLLLDYFPCPEQRYSCVHKAYRLLKPEGLLFIITPDSKHSSANAQIMKNWRITLAQLGFSRIYYDKLPHIHCMAYRKDINPEVSKRWVSYKLPKKNYVPTNTGLHIPQDFHKMNDQFGDDLLAKIERTTQDDDALVQLFSQLPYNSQVAD